LAARTYRAALGLACARGFVPVLLPDDRGPAGAGSIEPPPGLWWTRSGAQVLPGVRDGDQETAARLLARVRLAAGASTGGFPLDSIAKEHG
jgi:hypothetical protein